MKAGWSTLQEQLPTRAGKSVMTEAGRQDAHIASNASVPTYFKVTRRILLGVILLLQKKYWFSLWWILKAKKSKLHGEILKSKELKPYRCRSLQNFVSLKPIYSYCSFSLWTHFNIDLWFTSTESNPLSKHMTKFLASCCWPNESYSFFTKNFKTENACI